MSQYVWNNSAWDEDEVLYYKDPTYGPDPDSAFRLSGEPLNLVNLPQRVPVYRTAARGELVHVVVIGYPESLSCSMTALARISSARWPVLQPLGGTPYGDGNP